jgi:hypothetical protein
VVREGEFQLAANAGGIWDKMSNLIDRYEDGVMLPPRVRQEIAELSRELMSSYVEEYSRVRGNYTRRIDQLEGTTAEDVMTQLGTPIELDAGRAVSPTGASPQTPAAPDVPITVENAPMPNDPTRRRVRFPAPTDVPAPTDLNTADSPDFLEAFDRYSR